MIFTDPVTVRTPGLVLEDFGTSMQDFLGATAGDAFVKAPTSSLFRFSRDREAETGLPLWVPGIGFLTPPSGKLSRQLSAEEASERAKHLGLKFDKPIREKRLKMLMDRKTAEVKRLAVIRQGENMNTHGLGFLTALAASAVDPIQIAASFVPIVGQAKFAAMAARVGRIPARATTGLIEGFAGSVLIEPIVLGQALSEQADYDLYDSLMNIAFGTLIGGGLHVAFGSIGEAGRAVAAATRRLRDFDESITRGEGRVPMAERIDAVAPETREAALRMTLAELNAGRSARIADDILPLDPSYRATGEAVDFRGSTSTIALQARQSDGAPISFDVRGVPNEGAIVPHTMTRDEFAAVMGAKDADASQIRVELEATEQSAATLRREIEQQRGRRGNAERRRKLRDIEKRIAELKRRLEDKPSGRATARSAEFEKQHRQSVKDALDRGEALPDRVLTDYPELRERATGEGLVLPEDQFSAGPMLRKFQERLSEPTEVDIADFASAKRARDEVELRQAEADPDKAQELATEQQQRLTEMLDAVPEARRKEILDEIKAVDDEIAAAKEHAKAVRAAALCQIRKADVA